MGEDARAAWTSGHCGIAARRRDRGAFDTLAAQVPEDATWAAVGPPEGLRVRPSDNLPWTALSGGAEADPWPSSEDREVVQGKQGK